MKENRGLFTVVEKFEHFWELGRLYIEAGDIATQLIMIRQGNYEKTAVFRLNELKAERMEEIGRRKSIIGNG